MPQIPMAFWTCTCRKYLKETMHWTSVIAVYRITTRYVGPVSITNGTGQYDPYYQDEWDNKMFITDITCTACSIHHTILDLPPRAAVLS